MTRLWRLQTSTSHRQRLANVGMGQERIIVKRKNWQEKREIQYWTRPLNITESEARRPPETMNNRVEYPVPA